MIEISTSILNVEKGKEAETFLALEKSKTDYFHIDVMDGEFVERTHTKICLNIVVILEEYQIYRWIYI